MGNMFRGSDFASLLINTNIKNCIQTKDEESCDFLENQILNGPESYRIIDALPDGTCVDGHTRIEIMQKHGIEPVFNILPEMTEIEAILYRIEKHLAGRNMNDFWTRYLSAYLYLNIKYKRGGDVTLKTDGNTKTKIARMFKTSESTITRNIEFLEAIDRIAEICGDEYKRLLLDKIIYLRMSKILHISQMQPVVMQKDLEMLKNGGSLKTLDDNNRNYKTGKKPDVRNIQDIQKPDILRSELDEFLQDDEPGFLRCKRKKGLARIKLELEDLSKVVYMVYDSNTETYVHELRDNLSELQKAS